MRPFLCAIFLTTCIYLTGCATTSLESTPERSAFVASTEYRIEVASNVNQTSNIVSALASEAFYVTSIDMRSGEIRAVKNLDENGKIRIVVHLHSSEGRRHVEFGGPKRVPEGGAAGETLRSLLKNINVAVDSPLLDGTCPGPTREVSVANGVRLLYATIRESIPGSGCEVLGPKRDPFGNALQRMTFGEALVTIPPKHKIGKIERPQEWVGVKLPDDPSEHFTLAGNVTFSLEVFEKKIKSANRKKYFIFVHGFNTTFEEAAFVTAQISYDIGFEGIPLFFSWTSSGEQSVSEYLGDQDRAKLAAPYLAAFLSYVKAAAGQDADIYVLAHSLGAQPLVEALQNMHQNQSAPTQTWTLASQVIFAAPDEDVSVFKDRMQAIAAGGESITIYASCCDKALQFSAGIRAEKGRAGLVVGGRPAVILKGIDTIDASVVSDNLLDGNHDAFQRNRLLLGDIGNLVETGVRPPSRRSRGLFEEKKYNGIAYWRIRN